MTWLLAWVDVRLVSPYHACSPTPTPHERGLCWTSDRSLCFRLRLKRDGTRAETRFRLSPKRTIPFKSAGASVQSTAGSRGVRIGVSNAGYTMFRGSVIGYPLHSPVSPSLPLPCVTVCHQVSNALCNMALWWGCNRKDPIVFINCKANAKVWL